MVVSLPLILTLVTLVSIAGGFFVWVARKILKYEAAEEAKLKLLRTLDVEINGPEDEHGRRLSAHGLLERFKRRGEMQRQERLLTANRFARVWQILHDHVDNDEIKLLAQSEIRLLKEHEQTITQATTGRYPVVVISQVTSSEPPSSDD